MFIFGWFGFILVWIGRFVWIVVGLLGARVCLLGIGLIVFCWFVVVSIVCSWLLLSWVRLGFGYVGFGCLLMWVVGFAVCLVCFLFLVCLVCLWRFFAAVVATDCCFCLLIGFIVLDCWLTVVFCDSV